MAMKMAVRASAVTPHHSLPSLPSSSHRSDSKSQFRPISVGLPASTTLSMLALISSPYEARALNKDQIVSSLNDVEKTIDQVQEAGSNFFDIAQQLIDSARTILKPGVDAALPIVKQAGEEALKVASPTISEASKKALEALQGSGIDTQPVLTAAQTVVGAAQQTGKVIEGAKPIASSTVETISTADPLVIAEIAGVLAVAYLLFPPIWSAISFSFRGYKGELSPAQTLELISSSNYVLIDIRSEKDKDKSGIPRLPSSAKNQLIAIPLEELPSKLRGIVRNVKKLEAELSAIKISYLKKLNKGSNIVILGSYSDSGKAVAKALTRLGFKNSWIVTDGFLGSKGWLQSRLGTDTYKFSFAEILSPSRVIPAATKRFGTTSLTASGQKLLPGAD
ncbi:calcium sensing receptor, chloroplastic [Cucurbita pepo subsp. pepo]|uniref:calcium sensing receptor, chloroplastic n=1 Tax=Cucurbita pepo subsp. pepo TaxID=3664 RepID=UPI000C9D4A24|nr:calcium sensing receptor, chloroplastic [Cucurbita pepo subsp. pepo]